MSDAGRDITYSLTPFRCGRLGLLQIQCCFDVGKCKKRRKIYMFLAAIGLFPGPAHRKIATTW